MPKTGRQNVAGGVYHVTARGNARETIFRDEFDYVALLRGLSETVEHYGVCRYVALNPVRAGLCDDPASWPWSSYRATAGLERHPPYLCVDWVRGLFGSARAFRDFVRAGL